MKIWKLGNRLAISVLAVLATTTSGYAQTVGIGSNPQGSAAYSTAAAIAKVVSEKTKLKGRVVPQGGPVITLPLVNAGELEFSISHAIPLAFALKGKAMFKKRPQSDVRMVAALFNLNVGFFVKADSPIKSLADLKGKRVSTKFTKQKVVGLIGRATLATVGLSYNDIQGVPVPNGVRGVDDFISGKVDAGIFSVTSGKVKQAHAAVGGIRWLPIANTPEANAALAKIAPASFVQMLQPSKNRPGMDKPTGIFGGPFLLVASLKTPDQMVYEVVKALHSSKSRLASSHKAFGGFVPGNMALDIGIPIHPGAKKFYVEKGISK